MNYFVEGLQGSGESTKNYSELRDVSVERARSHELSDR